jgi:hypothetical protein
MAAIDMAGASGAGRDGGGSDRRGWAPDADAGC